ncbi:MAG: hypothetical protein J6C18_01570 [Bacteroidaceae bacterium]|nr:hypothetical protein [Bacteroidaceae bacterium]
MWRWYILFIDALSYLHQPRLGPTGRLKGIFNDRPITIGENVWLGGNVTVLPSVTIGDRAVIGAGSVVTQDIPADSIPVSNPCRVVRQN